MESGINKKILIIIPCYNEMANVAVLLEEIKKTKIENCSILPLFINDASLDETKQTLLNIGAVFLDNVVNLGIGGTVQLGFIYALRNGYDFAVQMDGDGQHPPRELHKLILPLLNNEADVAIGSRFIDNNGFRSTAMRRVGINFFSKLNQWLVKIKINDATSGYRAYNKKAIEACVEYYPDEYPEPETIIYLAHKAIRMKEYAVIMNQRMEGSSSIRKFTSLYYMAKVTLNSITLHFKMKFNG